MCSSDLQQPPTACNLTPAMTSSNGPAADGNLLPNPLEADARNGQVPVHSFNPEASPSEKAAAAGQSSDKLKSITPGAKSTAGARGNAHLIPFDARSSPPSSYCRRYG